MEAQGAEGKRLAAALVGVEQAIAEVILLEGGGVGRIGLRSVGYLLGRPALNPSGKGVGQERRGRGML